MGFALFHSFFKLLCQLTPTRLALLVGGLQSADQVVVCGWWLLASLWAWLEAQQ